MQRSRPAPVVLCVFACACNVSVAPAVAPPTGSVTIDWTIDDTKDPGRCFVSGAATFHIALFAPNGASAGEFVQNCTAFDTTIDGLVADVYTGQAELLDANGTPRTTSISLAPIDVTSGAQVAVSVDFPFTSFF